MHRSWRSPASRTFQQLFLFFIVPLYIFNYFGSMYSLGGSNLSVGMTIVFITCLVAYILKLFYGAGKRLFLNVSNFRDCDVLTKIVVTLSFVAIVLPVVYKKNSKHIFIWLYFHLPAGSLWQSHRWVLKKWLQWLYSAETCVSFLARFVCSRHARDYGHCGVDFHSQGNNGQRGEPLGITTLSTSTTIAPGWVFSIIISDL